MPLDAATPIRMAVRHDLALEPPPTTPHVQTKCEGRPARPRRMPLQPCMDQQPASGHGPWNLEEPCPFAAAGGTLSLSALLQPTLRVSNHALRHRQFHLLVSCAWHLFEQQMPSEAHSYTTLPPHCPLLLLLLLPLLLLPLPRASTLRTGLSTGTRAILVF